MPRETRTQLTARANEIISKLRRTYPDAHCELNYSTPLELLIATILSAQCSDQQVNRVTPELFRKYPTAADYAAAPAGELELAIQRIGLFRNKAKSIRAACQKLVLEHGGEVPRSLEALIRLDGVGRKTANVVLGNAFGIESGIVVDTHVARLSQRLRLTKESDPVKIERALIPLVRPQDWTQFSHWLIWHGRRRCFARSPDCEGCEIRELCPSGTSGSDLRAKPHRRPTHPSDTRTTRLSA